MYLVDTSVWISCFRGQHNATTELFNKILAGNIPHGITSIIYQEIIQGAISSSEMNQLKKYLRTQKFFQPKNQILSYESAGEIYFTCRSHGFTIRSTIDCLIAQICIEHDLTLLHNDKDFEKIAKVFKNLKLAETP